MADPSESARLEALAESSEEAEGFATVEALLSHSDPPQVVHICTPMETHATIAQAALRAGCDVYVEKPVASTLPELLALQKLAADRELLVCGGHQVLFEGPYRKLVDRLPGLGVPVHIESFFSFKPVRTRSTGGRPLTNAEQLVDVLPHPTYLLLDLLERLEPTGEAEVKALSVSPERGTVHGLVSRGPLAGTLTASLKARPVEHWLKVIGSNGMIHADFVRGTTIDLFGPGASGIDKALNPYRLATQGFIRTTGSLVRRVRKRDGSYPGLDQIFETFYDAVQSRTKSPTSVDQLRDTVKICEIVGDELRSVENRPGGSTEPQSRAAEILVTGGTGLLGREILRLLVEMGVGVRSLSRRLPEAHDLVPGVDYVHADLGQEIPSSATEGIRTVIHCAAETSGGWEAHQRNSIDATERLLRAAASRGVQTFVHVSSVAVVSWDRPSPIPDDAPLHSKSRSLGPYVWGKLESERTVTSLSAELGITVRVVRPVPLVNWDRYSPPGRLGRRVGNLFVAVGRPGERVTVASAEHAARGTLAAALHPQETPQAMNLVPASSPTRRFLIERLKETNPEVRIIWLPKIFLYPLSWGAVLLQKLMKPSRPAIHIAQAFAAKDYAVGPASEWMDGARSLKVSRSEERVARYSRV